MFWTNRYWDRFYSDFFVPCTLLHTHLSPPHEVCDSPDQAAHYHTLGSKFGASSLTGTWSLSKRSLVIRFEMWLALKQYVWICNKWRQGQAQAVSRRPVTSEVWFRACASQCGIRGGLIVSGTGGGLRPSSSVSAVNIISPWLSILIYHLVDEK